MNAQNIIVEYEFKANYNGIKGREFLIQTPAASYYFDYVETDNPTVQDIISNYNIKRGGHKMFRKLSHQDEIYRIRSYPNQFREQSLIIDKKPDIKWKVQKENKDILGFLCTKATGFFRGREYTVWFTKDLPSQLGPWKLDGLPGLILEARDHDNVSSYKAVQLIKDTSLSIPDSVVEFVDSFPKDQVKPFKDYIEKENIALKDRQEKALSNLPKGTKIIDVPNVRDLLREKSFEWED